MQNYLSKLFNFKLMKIIVLMSCLTPAMLISPVQAQDTTGNRLEAAQRYLKIADMSKMFADSAQQIALNLPENERQKFIEHMSGIDVQKLEQIMVVTLVQHFTLDEINAMEKFYGSALGKSIMKKFPTFMATMAPSMEKMMVERAKEFRQ